MSFKEKLSIVYNFIFDEDISINDLKIDFNDNINEELNLFYTLFKDKKDFMKSYYDIKLPNEIITKNNMIVLAVENQNVCSYGYDMNTEKVIYIDDTNNIYESLDIEIDDFILYLIAIQCMGFLSSAVISDCSNLLKEKYSQNKITKVSDNMAVYYFDEKVLLFVDNNNGYIAFKDDKSAQVFENNTKLEVNYF